MLTILIVERLLADAEAERRRARQRAALVRDALSVRHSSTTLRVRLGIALIRTGEALASRG
ncbi:MAG: hypothetical protein KGM44_08065 [bacterium]|nr:hypothetical protein [bacterium]